MPALMRAFTPLVNNRLARGLLSLLGVPPSELAEPLAQADQLLSDMAGAILTFTPAGWAPSSQVPAKLYTEALGVYRRTGSIEL